MNVANTVGVRKQFELDPEVLAGIELATAAGLAVLPICGRDCALSWHLETHRQNPRSVGKLPVCPSGTRGPSARTVAEFLDLAQRYPATAGYGLLCSELIMLLDLDGPNDVEAVRQLIKEGRLPAPTAWVRTPRAYRLGYRRDSSGAGYTLDAHGERIKILGDGAHGVGGGSIGWDGTRYTACGDWRSIENWPVLPDELRPMGSEGGQGERSFGSAWPGSDGEFDPDDPLGSLTEVRELRRRYSLQWRVERWRRCLDGALARGNTSRGRNSGAGAEALSLLRRAVVRLCIDPWTAAETMTVHPWNAAAIDESGAPWLWTVEGQDGLLRLARKAASPRGCPASMRPGDWLAAKRAAAASPSPVAPSPGANPTSSSSGPLGISIPQSSVVLRGVR